MLFEVNYRIQPDLLERSKLFHACVVHILYICEISGNIALPSSAPSSIHLLVIVAFMLVTCPIHPYRPWLLSRPNKCSLHLNRQRTPRYKDVGGSCKIDL